MVFGMLAALGVFQLDAIEHVRRAEHKPLQLKLAQALGLDVPRTLMTNDPDEVRAFAASCPSGVVTKMTSSFAVYVEQGQEQVAKAVELRVRVVGDQVMAAAIDSQARPGARNDWRREGVALIEAWQPYTLPEPVRLRVLRLMDALGLNYGAFDFIVTPEGRHVFLEVNPVGEFMWLLRYPGLPIAEALADVLAGHGMRRRGPRGSTQPVRPASPLRGASGNSTVNVAP